VKKGIALLILFLGSSFLFAQGKSEYIHDDDPRENKGVRIVFYNVENLFDTQNDPLTRDDEYTPDGTRNWSEFRFREKVKKLGQVILSVGGWEAPEIVGVCEIENRYVLERLINESALKKTKYEIVHQDSKDGRGIDVALLYRPDKFEVLHKEFIFLKFPYDTTRKSRDILYVHGKAVDDIELHLFVNHWPSRFGGQLESEPGRIFAAETVKKKCEEILAKDPLANIIIMGDFNDEPMDKSIRHHLGARKDTIGIKDTELFNMMYEKIGVAGTHKYQSHWGVLDQFIVSGALIKEKNNAFIKRHSANIFKAAFLLETDEVNMGYKPYRTFVGFKYHGGYSDHLPVFIDVMKKAE
jgi:predicted extracellular nuclease